MSKTKQWIEESTETKVDNIIDKLTSGEITRSDVRDQIMNVDNIAMLGIDENIPVDEVIYEIMLMRKSFLILFLVFVYTWSWSIFNIERQMIITRQLLVTLYQKQLKAQILIHHILWSKNLKNLHINL